ncbi:hypothetical protein FPZ43_04730 [Mucilaginibacter pallidiroseus]|uniref:Uncharacterized protein n=1 Tax=Mucilaginibacter pallidiroseus TaxID=2599295 RepID=A0A563UFU8_9SPHI|nr:hypothetical protein [Mucilaginibacter pallidiroseus]TWR30252.1 hypothetical protein FPZ43_04730 [Mucilaginibacter pallidiroseus]
MKPKRMVIESIIVISSFVLTALLLNALTGSPVFGKKTIDINLHDTYFVIELSLPLILTPGLIFITIIYLFRNTYAHFKNHLQNLVLLGSLFLLNLFTIQAIQPVTKVTAMLGGKWTVQPPLPNQAQSDKVPVSPVSELADILFYVEIILLLILVAAAVLTGKNWKRKNRNVDALPK